MRPMRRGGLVEQVIDELGAHIVSGSWPAGHRLPSVAELADQLDVGRSTVREAVQALAHRGLLDVQQGRGTFVAAAREVAWEAWLHRAEVLDVYEARRGLEVDAARLAALRRTDADLDTIREAAGARHDARSSGVVSEWAAADLAFHRAVVAATHNPVLVRLFDTLADAITEAFARQTADPGSEVDTAADHDALVEALVRGDPEAAMAATRRYLSDGADELRRLRDAAP